MSKEVKRYGMCGFESGIVEMEDGPFVAWDDYDALLAERDQLKAENKRLDLIVAQADHNYDMDRNRMMHLLRTSQYWMVPRR